MQYLGHVNNAIYFHVQVITSGNIPQGHFPSSYISLTALARTIRKMVVRIEAALFLLLAAIVVVSFNGCHFAVCQRSLSFHAGCRRNLSSNTKEMSDSTTCLCQLTMQVRLSSPSGPMPTSTDHGPELLQLHLPPQAVMLQSARVKRAHLPV